MYLIEDLLPHRLGEVDTGDFGPKVRTQLFELDMAILGVCRVRHLVKCAVSPDIDPKMSRSRLRSTLEMYSEYV